MTLSMYTASVPVFNQMLGSVNELLSKAQTHCTEKKIAPTVLLSARLFPDMFPLSRQVQIACDFARGVSARLAGVDVPTNEDKEQTCEELQALIARTLSFLGSLQSAQFEGSGEREIEIHYDVQLFCASVTKRFQFHAACRSGCIARHVSD